MTIAEKYWRGIAASQPTQALARLSNSLPAGQPLQQFAPRLKGKAHCWRDRREQNWHLRQQKSEQESYRPQSPQATSSRRPSPTVALPLAWLATNRRRPSPSGGVQIRTFSARIKAVVKQS